MSDLEDLDLDMLIDETFNSDLSGREIQSSGAALPTAHGPPSPGLDAAALASIVETLSQQPESSAMPVLPSIESQATTSTSPTPAISSLPLPTFATVSQPQSSTSLPSAQAFAKRRACLDVLKDVQEILQGDIPSQPGERSTKYARVLTDIAAIFAHSGLIAKPKQGQRFPRQVIQMLETWALNNEQGYEETGGFYIRQPNDEELNELVQRTSLRGDQIRQWITNRNRAERCPSKKRSKTKQSSN